jgi:hypothetical protein
MYYLTYRKSNDALPIARDGQKIVYITNKKEEDDEEMNQYLKNIDFDEIAKNLGITKMREKEKFKNDMMNHLKKKIPPIDDSLRVVYENIVQDIKSGKSRNQIITNNTLCPIGSDNTGRFVLYCSGGSGSGKSYFLANIAKEYRKMYPDRDIYLFSFVDALGPYEGIENLFKIPLNRKFLEQEVDMNEFESSLLILDDYDATDDKQLKAKIEFILNRLLTTGRHLKCSIAMTSHTNTDYKRTRLILAESTHIVFYPQTASQKSLLYLLENYTNLSKPQIKNMIKLKSTRWVMVHKSPPPFYITEHSIEIL